MVTIEMVCANCKWWDPHRFRCQAVAAFSGFDQAKPMHSCPDWQSGERIAKLERDERLKERERDR
jgi:hypothetical protein